MMHGVSPLWAFVICAAIGGAMLWRVGRGRW